MKQKQRQRQNRLSYHKYQQMWRDRNPDHAIQYRIDHQELFRLYAANRRAAKLNATPTWYEAELIAAIYKRAAALSHGGMTNYQVDHIIPLQHELVCGLHCYANLRIITEAENKTKSNTHHVMADV